MTTDDQIICILGKDKLIQEQAVKTLGWLKPDSDGAVDCTTRNRCTDARRELFQKIWYPSPTCVALKPWKIQWGVGMCDDCVAASVQKHAAGREKIWSMLPSIFELPLWEDLLTN
jgi:hypothetical protein